MTTRIPPSDPFSAHSANGPPSAPPSSPVNRFDSLPYHFRSLNTLGRYHPTNQALTARQLKRPHSDSGSDSSDDEMKPSPKRLNISPADAANTR